MQPSNIESNISEYEPVDIVQVDSDMEDYEVDDDFDDYEDIHDYNNRMYNDLLDNC